MHDLIIENATLIDGLGTPRRHGAVAVRDGRIVQVGVVEGMARERLDRFDRRELGEIAVPPAVRAAQIVRVAPSGFEVGFATQPSRLRW